MHQQIIRSSGNMEVLETVRIPALEWAQIFEAEITPLENT